MEDGIEILNDDLDAGRDVGWIDPAGLPDDAWTVTTARLGGRPAETGGPTAEDLAVYGLREPDVQKPFLDLGAKLVGNTPDQFAAFVVQERERYGALTKAAGIKPQ